jgi:hypothetical protein
LNGGKSIPMGAEPIYDYAPVVVDAAIIMTLPVIYEL